MSCNNQKISPFYHNSCSELRNSINQHGEKVSYPSKTRILGPGDQVNHIYYIDSGRVRYYAVSPDGDEKILMILEKGSFFGEGPLFSENTPLISVISETPTILYKLDKTKVNNLFDSSLVFRNSILKCLSNKILILMNEVENLSFSSCKSRLLKLLCSSVDKDKSIDGNWYKLKIQYTQHEMANIIGSTRVTVAKLISELCEDHKIRLINRKIQVNCTNCPIRCSG